MGPSPEVRMAQSSLTHSLSLQYRRPGTRWPCFWQQCALPWPRDLLSKTCLLVGRDRGWERSLNPMANNSFSCICRVSGH